TTEYLIFERFPIQILNCSFSYHLDSNCIFFYSRALRDKSVGVIWADFRGVFPYLIAGIAIGSIIYGYQPRTLLDRYAGPANPFAIPVATIIGVPLYIRAEAVITLAAALLAKGVGAGTVLALGIGSAGASLTELILLRALFRFRLLAAFVLVIISMAIMAGYTAYLFF
ncbi:permease, partial [Lelliottia amnigena]|uniref:permease n=1 Tax=Lelliottia amnigena TaxID=61646 RepID=UPI00192BB40C